MAVIHVSTKQRSVGFEIRSETPAYDIETFVKMLMDNGYWVRIDPIPESMDLMVSIKADDGEMN